MVSIRLLDVRSMFGKRHAHYGLGAADSLDVGSGMGRDESEVRGDVEIERAGLRKIQFLIVLLSCLPRDGKCREVLELALALDEGPQMARLTAVGDLGTNDDVLRWLESLWAREELSPQERELVWWQNDGRNMDAAIRELETVEARQGTTWTIAPSTSFLGNDSGESAHGS